MVFRLPHDAAGAVLKHAGLERRAVGPRAVELVAERGGVIEHALSDPVSHYSPNLWIWELAATAAPAQKVFEHLNGFRTSISCVTRANKKKKF